MGLSEQLLTDIRAGRALLVEQYATSHAQWVADGKRLDDARATLLSVGVAPSEAPAVVYGGVTAQTTEATRATPPATSPRADRRARGDGYRAIGLPILRLIAGGTVKTGEIIKALAAQNLVPADDKQYTSQIASQLVARGFIVRLQEGRYSITPAGHTVLKANALPPFESRAGE
jgi:predicted transcriptional regulator